MKTLLIGMLAVLCASMPLRAEDDLKQDAVSRVVKAHDPALFIATGALYLKQSALRAARGKPLSQAALSAVEQLIDDNVRDTAWFERAWGTAIDRHLSAEEADEIATHFATEGGRLQRRVIELAVSEVLTSNYTFTDRIDHRMKGSERELKDLQRIQAERLFKGVQDFSAYPDTVKFASSGAGPKYMKMLMIQGLEAITVHFEELSRQIRGVVAASVGQGHAD
ncbi:MAG: hypothetical protein FJY37_08690 [Betaproteobacteria bacterium]|nr:hypothetical protein [Betaproteobacteria bacterium]